MIKDSKINKNTAFASDDFEDSEGTRSSRSRIGTWASITNARNLSSANGDKFFLKPTEGIEPSVSRVPILELHQAAGLERLYHILIFK